MLRLRRGGLLLVDFVLCWYVCLGLVLGESVDEGMEFYVCFQQFVFWVGICDDFCVGVCGDVDCVCFGDELGVLQCDGLFVVVFGVDLVYWVCVVFVVEWFEVVDCCDCCWCGGFGDCGCGVQCVYQVECGFVVGQFVFYVGGEMEQVWQFQQEWLFVCCECFGVCVQ